MTEPRPHRDAESTVAQLEATRLGGRPHEGSTRPSAAERTVIRFSDAIVRADVEGLLAETAADAVLHSPVVGGLEFRGRDALARLFTATTACYQDIEVVERFGVGDRWCLSFTASIGRKRRRFRETLLLRVDADGRIQEMSATIRPITGLAAVAQVVGAAIVRPASRPRAVLMRVMTAPLVRMARTGERVGPLLLGMRRTQDAAGSS